MRTTTYDTTYDAAPNTDAKASVRGTEPSTWKRLLDTLIEARTAQARLIVANHMAHHDDETFKRIGWTEAEIAAMRKTHAR